MGQVQAGRPSRSPLSVLAFLLLLRCALAARLPGPLLAVLLATAAVVAFGLQPARGQRRRPGPGRGCPVVGLPALHPG